MRDADQQTSPEGDEPSLEETTLECGIGSLQAGFGAVQTAGPGDVLGAYRLEKEIGRGGQGVVYRAIHTRTKQVVAVKILRWTGPGRDRLLAYFRREAEIAASLDHPGLCTVFDTEVQGGVPYIAMRFLEGQTLTRMIPDEPATGSGSRDALVAVVTVLEKAGRALHVAHEAGIIHRDIKPGNIMVTPDGDPVIMDFGLARGDDGEFSNLTQSGDMFGTPAFMSPEQVGSGHDVDRRADVWALGVTLYGCLTGKRPFEAPTRDALYQQILSVDPPDPRRLDPRVSRDLATVVLTALEKNPGRRYQTAEALAEDLRRVREREPVSARPITAVTRAIRWTQRNPALAATAAMLFVAILLGIGVSLMKASEAEANLQEWERLAERHRIEILAADAAELWPAHPDRIPAFEAWLTRAGVLLSRLDGHRQALETLRERADPWTPEQREADRTASTPDRERLTAIALQLKDLETRRSKVLGELTEDLPDDVRMDVETDLQEIAELRTAYETSSALILAEQEERLTWTFVDPRDQIRHDGLLDVVRGLERLQSTRAHQHPTIAGMKARIGAARSLRARSLEEPADAWLEAVRRIAENPLYGGLSIEPQLGLVPLGPDSDSGLEEFAHVHLGQVPVRDPESGRLQIRIDTGLVLVLLPGGTFTMGAQKTAASDKNHDRGAQPGEGPPHEVTLGPFFISKYEMTQAQWWRATGDRPSQYDQRLELVTPRNPVTNLPWATADRVLRRLDLILPTEAQWEYACRGQTDHAWWTGDAKQTLVGAGNFADQSAAAIGAPWKAIKEWPELDDGYPVHAPVGVYRANPFGLHDVHGNVFEWCRDWYVLYDTASPRPGDGLRGTHEESRGGRVIRGGGYGHGSEVARCAYRIGATPGLPDPDTGVRPARMIDRD